MKPRGEIFAKENAVSSEKTKMKCCKIVRDKPLDGKERFTDEAMDKIDKFYRLSTTRIVKVVSQIKDAIFLFRIK